MEKSPVRRPELAQLEAAVRQATQQPRGTALTVLLHAVWIARLLEKLSAELARKKTSA